MTDPTDRPGYGSIPSSRDILDATTMSTIFDNARAFNADVQTRADAVWDAWAELVPTEPSPVKVMARELGIPAVVVHGVLTANAPRGGHWHDDDEPEPGSRAHGAEQRFCTYLQARHLFTSATPEYAAMVAAIAAFADMTGGLADDADWDDIDGTDVTWNERVEYDVRMALDAFLNHDDVGPVAP